ncbi:MAG: 1-(5-phosphoribosyl)-5-[(5-phosphoribosylamino)methylideneamino]imidazole-4-carboxamide isomerase [Clostridiales bacterium]|nr:1-(5-phosphoribosyl)-5-[(5-phosphoribosylamino)methylideneamino]imidazole-4-carboxamide isomerase [Clostridiales bacterium]
MIIFPAIDLYEGKAVRLYKGDYAQMTVYSEHPERIGLDFAAKGATHAHLVDLEGAKNGKTPNLETVLRIRETSGLFCEIGGGIRSMETVKTYLSAGLDRVILGTAAVEDPAFLKAAVDAYGDKIAVGVDVKDGFVAIKGWTEKSALGFMDFCRKMEQTGVRTLICTDISRDGAMRGTNREMYRKLSETLGLQITASGGVSTLEDIRSLRQMNLYGAIIGKAYYTGDIDLQEAIEEAQ